jgi:hypothetical protein
MATGTSSYSFTWLNGTILVACGATVSGMVALFGSAAIFRGFRLKNWDVLVCIVAAVFYMFHLTIMGDLIAPGIWRPFGEWADSNIVMFGGWMGLAYPLISIALTLRILTGRERGTTQV